jgi:hypothetical protein
VAGSWREKKATGGVLIDIEAGQIVLSSLAMPHSPRWHDGRLWLLNSGAGELLVADPPRGQAEVVCRLPGYLRGLCFHGAYALVGLSKIREKHIFGGLPVQQRCEKLLCGVAVVDLRSGREAGFFEFTAGCEELYDVAFLPGVRRPMILNLQWPAARQAISNPEACYWLRPSSEIRDATGPDALSSQFRGPARQAGPITHLAGPLIGLAQPAGLTSPARQAGPTGAGTRASVPSLFPSECNRHTPCADRGLEVKSGQDFAIASFRAAGNP